MLGWRTILQLLARRAAESIAFSVPDRNALWSRAEDDLLVQAVAKCSTSNSLGRDWIEVAWEMPGRLPQQCQERYRLAHICAELTFVFLRVTFRGSPLVPSAQATSLERTHPMLTSSRSSPCSRCSLSHAHKFMVFFRNRTALRAASASPTTYSVSDSIVAFTPAPTPRSRCSLSQAHKFMVLFRKRTALRASSASPTTYSVSDSIVAFTPAPTPRSRCSLSLSY